MYNNNNYRGNYGFNKNPSSRGGYDRPVYGQRPGQNFDEQSFMPVNYAPRGRGGRARGGFSQNKKPTQKPLETRDLTKDVKSDGPPVGQYLSKTTSDLKNDPLHLEAFMPAPSEALTAVAEELNHYPGFDGLSTLVNETHEQFAAHSHNYKKSVPLSGYAYYISVMSWARALKLKQLNRYTLTSFERDFLDVIYEQGNYVLPKAVGIYLAGLGNITLPEGPESKFNLKPYTYDRQGYFENMDQNFLCAKYPCIAIFAQRIMHDLDYTLNDDVDLEWLPNELDHNWNTRCLGYAPGVNLSHMEQQIFNTCGITDEDFPSDCEGLMINIRLLNNIQKYLTEVQGLETVPLPASITGSLGQLLIEVPSPVSPRTRLPIDIGSFNFVSKSPVKISASIGYLSGSFLYRISKLEDRLGFFFPYQIAAPTDEQLLLLDDLNTGWSPIYEGIYHFQNVDFKPGLRMKKVCSINIKI